MSKELQINIQKLHDALQDSPVDECTAASLKQTAEEIRLAVAQAEGKIPAEGYNDLLEQEAIRISEEHPKLSQAIRQLMVTLTSMGI